MNPQCVKDLAKILTESLFHTDLVPGELRQNCSSSVCQENDIPFLGICSDSNWQLSNTLETFAA